MNKQAFLEGFIKTAKGYYPMFPFFIINQDSGPPILPDNIKKFLDDNPGVISSIVGGTLGAGAGYYTAKSIKKDPLLLTLSGGVGGAGASYGLGEKYYVKE